MSLNNLANYVACLLGCLLASFFPFVVFVSTTHFARSVMMNLYEVVFGMHAHVTSFFFLFRFLFRQLTRTHCSCPIF